MNKVWPYAIVTVIILTSATIHQGVLAALPPTTKTYKNFGLGFQIQYPSNMTINTGSNVTTIDNPNPQHKSHNYFHTAVIVLPWARAIETLQGLSGLVQGLFTAPNLDTWARQFGLAITNENTTVTNKTKLVVDNTSAYLFQATTVYNHNSSQVAYHSFYLMLKGNVAYEVSFLIVDQHRFIPVEQKMIRSFRFI